MKVFIISILLIATMIISCEKTIYNTRDYAEIKGNIEDITLDEGISAYSIDLDEVFSVENETERVIKYTLESNSNADLVSAEISGTVLTLNLVVGQTGVSEISLRSQTEVVFKVTTFNLTVNTVTADIVMARAETHFQEAEYDNALSHFTLVTQKDTDNLKSDAYMGMGFSLMRLNDESGDYGYSAFELSLSFDSENSDARAGISLLEYAWKKNYGEAIRQGQTVLKNSPDYIFKYDDSLDKNDILLNIALSQYSSLLYYDCLDTVKELDPAYNLNTNDPQFEVILLQKLQELVEMYS